MGEELGNLCKKAYTRGGQLANKIGRRGGSAWRVAGVEGAGIGVEGAGKINDVQFCEKTTPQDPQDSVGRVLEASYFQQDFCAICASTT